MWHIAGCFWHIYSLCSGGMNHHSSHHWIKGDLPVCLVGIFCLFFSFFTPSWPISSAFLSAAPSWYICKTLHLPWKRQGWQAQGFNLACGPSALVTVLGPCTQQ